MLLYIILIIFGFVIAFNIYSSRFNNPFKMYMIFGKKGAGKSTFMVKMMLRYLKKGWNVYTDMPGVNIKGIYFFNTDDLAKFVPPPKSAIFIDEIGTSMDNRNFKKFPEGMRDLFVFQRKYKLVIYANSQALDVDLKVKNRIDLMYLQQNIGNVIGITRPIYKTVTVTEATSQGESRIADQLKFAGFFSWKWTWLPRYFKYFKSFNAPERDPLPAVRCADGLAPCSQLRILQRNLNKKNK